MTPLVSPPEPKLPLAPDLYGDLDSFHELRERLQALPGTARFTDEQVEIVYGIAYALYQQGKFDSAMGLFQVLITYRPLDARLMMAFALCCKRMCRFDAAIPAFSAALAIDPEQPEAIEAAIHLSECLAALGKAEECQSVLEPLLRLTEVDSRFDSIKRRAETLRAMLHEQQVNVDHDKNAH